MISGLPDSGLWLEFASGKPFGQPLNGVYLLGFSRARITQLPSYALERKTVPDKQWLT